MLLGECMMLLEQDSAFFLERIENASKSKLLEEERECYTERTEAVAGR